MQTSDTINVAANLLPLVIPVAIIFALVGLVELLRLWRETMKGSD